MRALPSRGKKHLTHQQEHSPAYLLTALKKGWLDREDCIEKFEQCGRRGRVRAADLALEQAFNVSNIETTSSWLNRAKQDYEHVVKAHVGDIIDDSTARAKLQLAQMGNYAYVAATESLPTKQIATDAYARTVDASKQIADSIRALRQNRRAPGTQDQLESLSGVAGEASALLLGQRFAINGEINEEWFSLLSLYSSKNSTPKGSTVSQAYDLDVLTQYPDLPLESTHQVQVRAAHRSSRLNYVDVSVVNVLPDLMLPRERHQLTRVIDECYEEMVDPSSAVGPKLDARTDNLLEKIDTVFLP